MTDEHTEAPQLQHAPELHADVHTDETGARYWQYLGGVERVYPHIPVTVRHYEMIKYPEIPAEDGHWTEVDWEEGRGWEVKAPDNTPVPAPIEDAIIAANADNA